MTPCQDITHRHLSEKLDQSLSDWSRFHHPLSGQVERMRAEDCGIANTADQEQYTVPTPRSSIPIRGEANSKEIFVISGQRMMPQLNARTVRRLFTVSSGCFG